MFKRRPFVENNKWPHPVEHDFNLDNLVVSGCSYVYNNSDQDACTWPYYLKEMGNFKHVLDCSMPGAGNHHIANTLIWSLETEKPNPSNSLIIVMWSGNDRDDAIVPISQINGYQMKVHYTDDVLSGITGGIPGVGNVQDQSFKRFSLIKDKKSRSIENYLYRIMTWSYLTEKGYRFVFLEHMNRSLLTSPRSEDFNIQEFLPTQQKNHLSEITTHMNDDLYTWALKNNFLLEDRLHPSPDGHLDWTRNRLIPTLRKALNEA